VSTIVFDFDGTLAESLETLLVVTNGLAKEFGFRPVAQQEFQRWRTMNSRELLAEKRVPWWKLPQLMRRVKKEQQRAIREIKLVKGMGEVLLALKDQGHVLGILTSNSSENVEEFLRNQGLADMFEFVYAGSTIFGKDRLLRRLIQQRQLDRKTFFYVGDEVRDIEAAHRVPVKAVAVAWGFNTVGALSAAAPDFLLKDPKELLDVVRPE
jgi:phosphoglycolate phosphatase